MIFNLQTIDNMEKKKCYAIKTIQTNEIKLP